MSSPSKRRDMDVMKLSLTSTEWIVLCEIPLVKFSILIPQDDERLQSRNAVWMSDALGIVPNCQNSILEWFRAQNRMDGYKEESSSSQDRQSNPTVHEVDEGSSQAEEGFPHAAFSITGTASPGTLFGGMQSMVPNPMYAKIGLHPGFQGTQGQFGVSQGNLGMAGFSIPPVNMTPRHQHVTGQGVQMAPTGPYQNGVWKVRVELPEAYPYKSPSIGFVNKIFHPNVDEVSGSVCLDVINQTWSPMFELINVFEVFLPQLLLYPNPLDPLNGEAAALMMRDKSKYEQTVREHCEKYAKPDDISNPPEDSSDAELSDAESESSDEEMAGASDP
ncbi:hypothetical protein L7F22_054952 [Adiantum nelumboides]|nr:hypothetical protein [Adiantum nelumboides]